MAIMLVPGWENGKEAFDIITALPQNLCRQCCNEVRTSAVSDPLPFSSSTSTV